MDKSTAKRLITQVCHSEPITAAGEYCITLDELIAFGKAAVSNAAGSPVAVTLGSGGFKPLGDWDQVADGTKLYTLPYNG